MSDNVYVDAWLVCVEFDKTLHRTFYDIADTATFGLGRFCEHIAEVVCDRADEINFELAVCLVLLHVAAEERAERVKHESQKRGSGWAAALYTRALLCRAGRGCIRRGSGRILRQGAVF